MSMKKWQHLKIPFEDIKVATNNFEDCIGKGGYGWVYKGQLSVSGVITTVAVKRLNETLGQGLKEFLTEIFLLDGQHHPNVICLLGYCDDDKEKIIVYEYAERGSLDKYLRRSNSTRLTWLERLKICVDAARGLDHLHNHVGKHQTIIHRDIKSANILLDENWVAKISDLGLSRLSFSGLDRSVVISHACGTPGYCEPEYIYSGIVKKESDVYSFGMVLFEAICGRLCCFKDDDGFLLSGNLAKEYYESKKLDEIIDPSLKEQISSYSMSRFSAIAYGCLHNDREQRPVMDVVTKELEEILKIQEEYEFEKEMELKRNLVSESQSDEYWETKLPRDVDEIIKMFEIPPEVSNNKKELFSFLRKGIFYDTPTKYFWINENGKKCLQMSAQTFIDVKLHKHLYVSQCSKTDEESCHLGRPTWSDTSPWHAVKHYSLGEFHEEVKCQIKTSMLSLSTMYEVSLEFQFPQQSSNVDIKSMKLITVKWRKEGLSVCSTNTVELRQGNWVWVGMWRFINHGPNAEFDVVIEGLSFPEFPDISCYGLLITGIFFQPIEMHEDIEGFTSLSISDAKDIDNDDDEYWERKLPDGYQHYDDEYWERKLPDGYQHYDDEYWERKLPDGYQHYIEMSDKPLNHTTKKELYFLLCEGFLADNGHLWLSLCKSTGMICSMLSATDILTSHCYKRVETSPQSKNRFIEVAEMNNYSSGISLTCKIQSHMFSPQYTYACYLVFKFENRMRPDKSYIFRAYYELDDIHQDSCLVDLKHRTEMDIPTINPKYGSRDTSDIPRTEALSLRKGHIEHGLFCWAEQREDGLMDEVMVCKPLPGLEHHTTLKVKLLGDSADRLGGMIVEGVEFRPYFSSVCMIWFLHCHFFPTINVTRTLAGGLLRIEALGSRLLTLGLFPEVWYVRSTL